MKKLLFLFAVLLTSVGAWAQVYQKITHHGWEVTALNEAGVNSNGIEGGTSFILDEDPATFYHSNYDSKYSGRNANKGCDGVQCFMVELPEISSFDRITYKGRSNGPNNWATKARIYIFDEFPEGWPKDGESYKALSALTYEEKEELLKKDNNTVLPTAIFDNKFMI